MTKQQLDEANSLYEKVINLKDLLDKVSSMKSGVASLDSFEIIYPHDRKNVIRFPKEFRAIFSNIVTNIHTNVSNAYKSALSDFENFPKMPERATKIRRTRSGNNNSGSR